MVDVVSTFDVAFMSVMPNPTPMASFFIELVVFS